MLQQSVSLTLLAGLASAFPHLGSLEDRQAASAPAFKLNGRQAAGIWQPPRAGDVRGPCPGLNTLANEGYISRTGRGISAQDVQNGFLAAFNMGPDATSPGANNAINLCSSLTRTTCATFDLDMLDQPHAIEHDGSLSRLDKEMSWNTNADNADFNATVWQMTLDIYGATSHIDVSDANTARLRRFEQARQDDVPGWFQKNDGGSLAEHAFTLTTMNDQQPGEAYPQGNLVWIDYWMRNERLPTAVGWTRPSAVIDNNLVNSVANAVNQATTHPAPPKTTAPPPPPPQTSTSTSTSSSSSTTTTSSKITSTAISTTTTIVPPPVKTSPKSSSPSSSSSSPSPTSTDKTSTDKSSTDKTSTAKTSVTTTSIVKTSSIKLPPSSVPKYPTIIPPYRNSSIPFTTLVPPTTRPFPTAYSTKDSTALVPPTTRPSPESETYATLAPPTTRPFPASETYATLAPPTTRPFPTAYDTSAIESSKTSAAESIATVLAGPAPTQANAYQVTYSPDQWKQITDSIGTYVQHVTNICQGLIGAWGMSNNAGWMGWQAEGSPQYGSMGSASGAPAPSCACA